MKARIVAAVLPPLWKLYSQRIGKLPPAMRYPGAFVAHLIEWRRGHHRNIRQGREPRSYRRCRVLL